jgi:hypothetical protein
LLALLENGADWKIWSCSPIFAGTTWSEVSCILFFFSF